MEGTRFSNVVKAYSCKVEVEDLKTCTDIGPK